MLRSLWRATASVVGGIGINLMNRKRGKMASPFEKFRVSEKRQVTVCQMRPGQSGTIVQILEGYGHQRGRGHGCHGLAGRLQALGVRPGKRITKLSGMFMRGPVTLQVGQAQLAIGYGMAGKILVEVDGENL
jgi:Fe2+ transport system protein FeoA